MELYTQHHVRVTIKFHRDEEQPVLAVLGQLQRQMGKEAFDYGFAGEDSTTRTRTMNMQLNYSDPEKLARSLLDIDLAFKPQEE